jgi:hypothetical protein
MKSNARIHVVGWGPEPQKYMDKGGETAELKTKQHELRFVGIGYLQ